MEKKLPNQIDTTFFEKVLIFNSLLGEHKQLYTAMILDYLNPDVIANENHRVVAKIIHDTYERSGRVPTVPELKVFLHTKETKDAFSSTIKGFRGISETSWDQGELILNTETFLKERLTGLALDKAIQRDNDGEPLNPAELLEDVEKAVNISLMDNLGVDLLNSMDWFETRIRQVSRVHSTGYPWLDNHIQGGFVADEGALYMFGGATNVGKSNLLGNFCVNMLQQNLKCLVISLEMSEYVYAKRILSMLSSVYLDEMCEDIDRVTEFVRNFREKNTKSQLYIKQFPTSSVHYKNLDAYIQSLARTKEFVPDVYFIDYPGIMIPFTKTGRYDTDIKRAHEEVRALSVMYKKPFISVLQLNKDGFDVDKPDLKTTGGSIGISQTSDFQANLYAREDDMESGHIGMSIQKSRFGAVKKTTKFNICENTLRITQGDLTGVEDIDYGPGITESEFDEFEKSLKKENGGKTKK